MDISQDRSGQYHGYQASFVQWLGVAALQCGFIFSRSPICQQAKNNKKQKPGKPNRSIAKYLVTALELIEQATFLKDSGRQEAVIPAGIKWCLKKTINLRQSHLQFRNAQTTDPDDWAAHKAFIQVLETCYNLLTVTPSKQVSPEKHCNDNQAQNDSLSNYFESLNLDDFESDDDSDSEPHEFSTLADSNGALEVFELEPTAEPKDDSFPCYSFFHDLHDIENRLLKTWQRCLDKQVPLAVAGLVTKVGIDAVRRFAAKALGRCGDHVSESYESLALPVFNEDASRTGTDINELLKSNKYLEHQPIWDFIYLTTYRTLYKFVRSCLDPREALPWPPPVTPWAYDYGARPDLRSMPEYLELEAKDIKLTQMLLDVLLDCDSRDPDRGQRVKVKDLPLSLVYDGFSRSMMALCNGQDISASMVFVAQIALNVARQHGGDDQPYYYGSLLASAQRADMILKSHASESTEKGLVTWPGPTKPVAFRCWELMAYHVQCPALIHLRRFYMDGHANANEKAGEGSGFPYRGCWSSEQLPQGIEVPEVPTQPKEDKQDSLPVMPHEDSALQNPLHCSSLALDLALSVEDLGISLANHHHAIFLVAHLYNALRQLGGTEISWPNMDKVMELQKRPIFANDVPCALKDIVQRFDYRIGRAFDGRQAMKFKPHEASNFLRSILDEEDIEIPLRGLQRILADREHGQKASSWQRDRILGPLQLLSRLEKHLPAILEDIEFDYITLNRHCCFIVAEIRTVMKKEQGEHLEKDLDEQARDFAKVYMILKTLCEPRRARGGGRPRWLQLVIDAFEKYVRERVV